MGVAGYREADLSAFRKKLAQQARESSYRARAAALLDPDGSGSEVEVRRGEVWRVGKHIVVCGDATDPGSWVSCPEVGLVVTDPPYGIGYEGGTKPRDLIANDAEEVDTLLPIVFAHVVEATAEGASWFVFEHPTMKPIDLLAYLIGHGSPGLVLDPFAGSGSTLVAAAQLDRPSFGIELDAEYCAVALRRLSEITGEVPCRA